MSGQSPPTTSGVVIISGSNNFDAHTSDFPVVRGTITDFTPDRSFVLAMTPASDTDAAQPAPLFITEFNSYHFDMEMTPAHDLDVQLPAPLAITDFIVLRDISVGFVPDFDNDFDIRSTTVTTSGVVVVDFFPGAGVPEFPYVPPVVIDERLFPVSSGTLFLRLFPAEGLRIFPVLPQYSTITPGD